MSWQTDSLHHPRRKIRSQVSEVLLTSRSFPTERLTRKSTEPLSCILSLFFACVNFSFFSPPERTRGEEERRWTQRERRCGGEQAGRCDILTCSDQMRMKSCGTSKDCGIPSRPRQRQQWQTYVSAVLGFDVHKDNKAFLSLVFVFNFTKETFPHLNATCSAKCQPIHSLIRRGVRAGIYHYIIRHHYLLCGLEVAALPVCMLSGYLDSLL